MRRSPQGAQSASPSSASTSKKKTNASQYNNEIDEENVETAEDESTKTVKPSKGLSWLKKKQV